MLPTIWYEMKWARATSQSINGPLDRTMVGKVSLILTYFRHSLHLLLPFSLWPPFSFLPWQVSFKVATLGESLIGATGRGTEIGRGTGTGAANYQLATANSRLSADTWISRTQKPKETAALTGRIKSYPLHTRIEITKKAPNKKATSH